VNDDAAVVTLVQGAETFLAERAVAAAVAAVRASAAAVGVEADVDETTAVGLSPAALAELASPSLFASQRVVVIRDVQEADDQLGAALVEWASSPGGEAHLVVVHPGGTKAKALLDRLRKAGARHVVCDRVSRLDDLVGFVRDEAAAAGGRIDEPAGRLLVDAVGNDLRSLSAAAAQLVADSGGTVSRQTVATYFEGRAEVKSFAVADRAVEGQTARAVEELRWALETGTAPVLVSSALASSVRTLVRIQALPRGARDSDVARDLGVPGWKLRTLRAQARAWTEEGLAAALAAAARADADVKGGSNDAALALSRAVIDIGAARRQQ
jgi:DNA polymerase-3 subunit delta